ncbi:MAG: winged helix-turn-helix domain-containing protein [Candidatus Zixiibacteriota bacterium]
MKEQIGETAGKVWQALSEHGELDLARLMKLVHEDEKAVHQALGWLAREEKIDIHLKGNKTTISLV